MVTNVFLAHSPVMLMKIVLVVLNLHVFHVNGLIIYNLPRISASTNVVKDSMEIKHGLINSAENVFLSVRNAQIEIHAKNVSLENQFLKMENVLTHALMVQLDVLEITDAFFVTLIEIAKNAMRRNFINVFFVKMDIYSIKIKDVLKNVRTATSLEEMNVLSA